MDRIINFDKSPDGLIPAVIQDVLTGKVLMLGYMNEEAYKKTQDEKIVTFFSRSKQRLWTKGETSNHFLHVKKMLIDCDGDTILIHASPDGPTCHTGADTCFEEVNDAGVTKVLFINRLRAVIKDRKINPSSKSYTSELFGLGINKVAQKVGEEAVELLIEAKDDNKDLFLGEAADLFYHYLVLLEQKNYEFDEVLDVLMKRHK
jgi:phosphoribosyl-ATP pyrophosphohydrolase/phosphoribosyl-AMP cyclohydrolase